MMYKTVNCFSHPSFSRAFTPVIYNSHGELSDVARARARELMCGVIRSTFYRFFLDESARCPRDESGTIEFIVSSRYIAGGELSVVEWNAKGSSIERIRQPDTGCRVLLLLLLLLFGMCIKKE